MAAGGKREGAGRKKGKRTLAKIEEATALQVLRESIIKRTDQIMRAFFFNINGLTHVFRIDKRKGQPDVHVLVESPHEIEQALNQIYGDEKNGGDDETEFYYVQSKDPDWRAAESLLNRAHGRPKETVEHSGPNGGPINVVSFRDGK